MNHYLNVIKKYAVFDGRSSRDEFWYFILFNFLIAFGLGIVEAILQLSPNGDVSILGSIYQLFILVPSVAVGIRRMHDVNKSGWYYLIPVYNLVLTVSEGTEGANRYGYNPNSSTHSDPTTLQPKAELEFKSEPKADLEHTPSKTKKTVYIIVGAILILGLISGGNLKQITDWSSDVMIGYNTFSLAALFGGAYFIYLGLKD